MATLTRPRLAVAALVATLVLLAVSSMRYKSPTADEGGHYEYGRRILSLDSDFAGDRYALTKNPFSAVNAVPWKLAEGLGVEGALARLATRRHAETPPSRNVAPEQVFGVLTGRLATIFFSCLLALLIYTWSRELYGTSGGLLSLSLYALSPNFLAHSRLVTADLFAALAVTFASYTLWRYLKRGGWGNATLSAAALGVAQLARHTCAYLLPVFAIVAIAASWRRWGDCMRSGDPLRLARALVRGVLLQCLFLGVPLLAINVGYLGNGFLTPLGDYEFKSDLFAPLQEKVLRVADVPLPVPAPYLVGLDAVRYYERTGQTFGNIYLLGELRRANAQLEGFKGYYFVAFLFKVPLATQIFLLAGFASHLPRKGREYLSRAELALFVPLVFFTLYFNFLYKAQIGLRHFLVVFPFLFILAGAATRGWRERGPGVKAATVALALWLVASVLSWFPHYLSYFNELVWDRKQAYKILADSNLDWGQSEWYLEDYLAENPRVRRAPRRPRPGTWFVGVNDLVGVTDPRKYWWLRAGFEPTDHVAYSYLVYHVTRGELVDAPGG